jgi:hypothetical protein
MFVHPELSFISLMVTPLLPIKLPACVAQINILHAICYFCHDVEQLKHTISDMPQQRTILHYLYAIYQCLGEELSGIVARHCIQWPANYEEVAGRSAGFPSGSIEQ